MKINPEEIDRMYALAGINKTALYAALRCFKDQGVDKKYKAKWTSENPTRGYCFVVTHFVKLAGNLPDDALPYDLRIDSKDEPLKHWYIKRGSGQWLDLTAEQFEDAYSEKLPPGRYEHGCPREWKIENRNVRKLENLYRRALRELGA